MLYCLIKIMLSFRKVFHTTNIYFTYDTLFTSTDLKQTATMYIPTWLTHCEASERMTTRENSSGPAWLPHEKGA